MLNDERIIFVNEDGAPTGETGLKLPSHTADTKLHLAFSCYIFNEKSKLFLMTRRALKKKVWPGVWTNSLCGHPMPGESIEAAIQRRAKYELGIDKINKLDCVLPKYVYKTPPFNGIIEHEFCPIYIAYIDGKLKPNPDEVEDYRWLKWRDYSELLKSSPEKMSYWTKDQYRKLKHIKQFSPLL